MNIPLVVDLNSFNEPFNQFCSQYMILCQCFCMVLIHMGADNKGMVSFCELQCQLPADLISFFWRNFAGLKCLTEMVGDHIICTLISAGQICILSFGQKKLCISKPGITLIAINEFSKIGFLRIFYIINNI